MEKFGKNKSFRISVEKYTEIFQDSLLVITQMHLFLITIPIYLQQHLASWQFALCFVSFFKCLLPRNHKIQAKAAKGTWWRRFQREAANKTSEKGPKSCIYFWPKYTSRYNNLPFLGWRTPTHTCAATFYIFAVFKNVSQFFFINNNFFTFIVKNYSKSKFIFFFKKFDTLKWQKWNVCSVCLLNVIYIRIHRLASDDVLIPKEMFSMCDMQFVNKYS